MKNRNLLLILLCGFLSISITAQNDQVVEEVFKKVEEMPRFPGCEEVTDKEERDQCSNQKMLEFIYKSLRYPAVARKNSIEGMVVVSFVIEKDGSIGPIEVIKTPDESLSEASVTVVEKMNADGIRWRPGKQRGKNVRVNYTLPIKFKLENDKKPTKQNTTNVIYDVPPPPPPPPPPPVEEIFKVVENMPRFPGCEIKGDKKTLNKCSKELMLQYISENLEYPKLAKENGVEGMCVVQFIVAKDGSLEEIEVVRDIGFDCGYAAAAVVEKMNKDGKRWIPGTQRGRKVKVQYTLPIKFSLNE